MGLPPHALCIMPQAYVRHDETPLARPAFCRSKKAGSLRDTSLERARAAARSRSDPNGSLTTAPDDDDSRDLTLPN